MSISKQEISERLTEIKFPRDLGRLIPPMYWKMFEERGWILLVYHNHPSVGQGRSAMGIFDPANKGSSEMPPPADE